MAFVFYTDISIFFGRRPLREAIENDTNCTEANKTSQVNSLLNNETTINCTTDAAQNPPCVLMSFPLTYDDGINLLPKRCDQDEAYFACNVPCKFLDALAFF